MSQHYNATKTTHYTTEKKVNRQSEVNANLSRRVTELEDIVRLQARDLKFAQNEMEIVKLRLRAHNDGIYLSHEEGQCILDAKTKLST
jgi:hypothetical protein